MPIEIRRMLFETDELCCLMTAQIVEGCSTLPAGKVLDVTVVKKDPLLASVTVQETKGGRQIKRTLDDQDLVAAITFFFQTNGIPMPRAAQKTVKLKGDKIAFDMVLKVSCPGS